jgi:hypothetical protein
MSSICWLLAVMGSFVQRGVSFVTVLSLYDLITSLVREASYPQKMIAFPIMD